MANLRNYINGLSEEAREIIEQFEFDNHITRMDDNNLLFLVVKRFEEVDLDFGRSEAYTTSPNKRAVSSSASSASTT